MELINFKPRLYQENIVKTCREKNTLVVLPTGTGKTSIALMLASDRLKKYPESKVLITAPTKPLCSQHVQTFKQHSTIPGKITLLTGAVSPEKRSEIWQSSIIIVATPQTIQSDLESSRINLADVSMICLDECHRSRQKYSNTFIIQEYLKHAKNQRILALTASPGSSKERIEEIYKNLAIEAIEIRTETDEDIGPYVQEKNFELVAVELPSRFIELSSELKKVHRNLLSKLKGLGYSKPAAVINKRDLLNLQQQFRSQLRYGNKMAFYGLSLVAQIIKLDHAITLIETQSIRALDNYLEKLSKEDTKAARAIINDKSVARVVNLTKEYAENNLQHPKMEKIVWIIKREIQNKETSRIIIFANYRDIVSEITKNLNDNNIKAVRFVGQADKEGDKGLKQKEQIEILQGFKNNEFNVLTASSIGEEGLDIPEVDAVVFYEPIPSELRKVQRVGRTGRTKPGKIIFLMAKKTIDEAYYWSSLRKEKKMKNILDKIKNREEVQARLN